VTGQTPDRKYNVDKPGCAPVTNFLYVGHTQNGVAAGVALLIDDDLHVYSDNFSGCEFHVLAQTGGTAAFLHVYRTGGQAVPYTLDSKWHRKAVIPTGGIVTKDTVGISVVAFAYVARGSKIAQCRVLILDKQGKVADVQGADTEWAYVELS
jgi:hypothetical protein